MFKKYQIISFIFLSIFLFSACSRNVLEEENEEENKFLVGVQDLSDFSSFDQELLYSGTISPLAEANIVAKSTGTLVDSQFNLADNVLVGDRLGRIDDLSSLSSQSSLFNSNQIKQAEIAVNQAKNSYDLALTNYNNILSSSKKELEQAEISFQQSLKNKDNLELTITENLASANIAYQTAQLSAEQAKLNLENQTKKLKQAKEDLQKNSRLIANLNLNSASTILTNINNITGFDRNNLIKINYEVNLGALDSSSLIKSRNLYNQLKDRIEKTDENEKDLNKYINQIIELIELTKDLSDSTKILFEKTISSSTLSQAQLFNLQNQVANLQNQASVSLSQINSVKQSLNNFDLEYKNNLEMLNKSYDLALKQKESARQNLNNLEAGNVSQLDQVGFSINLAENQLSNIEIKIQSQIESARSQVDASKMQYDNSLLMLDNLYDSYNLISPLSGIITGKHFSSGDTVSTGQLVYTISQIDKLKVVFFVDEESINNLKLGQEIVINNQVVASIFSLAPQADMFSRKFKVEAILDKVDFSLRKVVDIKIILNRKGENDDIYFLPLSSININQSGSFVFLYDEGKAKEIEVEILELIGERARVEIKDKNEAIIIVNGNRRLQAEQLIEIDIQ